MDKKRGLPEISAVAVKLMLCIMLAATAYIFIFYGIVNRVPAASGKELKYIESWKVTESTGAEYTTGRSFVADRELARDYTAVSVLPENIEDNEYMFFIVRRDTAVYIDGTLRKDYVEERDVKVPGGLVKRFYLTVPLRRTDGGKEVRLEVTSDVKDDVIVSDTFICTRFEAFSFLMHRDGTAFFLASIVLIFSLVVIIVSGILKVVYKMNIDMMYGALGIFILSLWILTDSYLFSTLFDIQYVNGLMNYLFSLMIPFAPGIYLNSVQRGRYKNLLSVGMLISVLNAIVWPGLHFTGILPFYDFSVRTIVNITLALMALAVAGLLIFDVVKGNAAEYRYTCIGFLGFLICGFLELVTILLECYDGSLLMVTGLAVLLVFVVIQQVDGLRRVSQEKQHAIDISEAKTRFLASMSHEIRTPINAILGMNEMILRDNEDKVIDEYSRSIRSSGKMLLMLVNDVLDFSKIEAGKLEIVETQFFMSEMLRDVIAMVGERANEKGLTLTTEIIGEVPDELMSDEFRIRQILVNYLNNAVKYTEKGTVTLKVGGRYTDDGYELELLVKDTGKGIRSEEQGKLFDAFSRADVKVNVNIEGTGLGLAIVKSIVDSMGGILGVDSVYGEGSEFWVKLPVKYVNKEPIKNDFMEKTTEHEKTQNICDFTAPDAKILAVDDNQSNLTIVKLFLKHTGIKLDLCNNGAHAIELCKEKKYDLILLDHMMPQPDGIETLHIIKEDADSLNRDTKAVVLTANAVAGSRQMYINEGFEDYLTKPLDAKVLEQTVKSLLPTDKVKEASPEKVSSEGSGNKEISDLERRITSVEGADYESALLHCAQDEEFLEEIVADIVKECDPRIERMRKSLSENDINSYARESHSIKSSMSTIGIKLFSERARKHEFAAKEGNREFISEDSEAFMNEYISICEKLKA